MSSRRSFLVFAFVIQEILCRDLPHIDIDIEIKRINFNCECDRDSNIVNAINASHKNSKIVHKVVQSFVCKLLL